MFNAKLINKYVYTIDSAIRTRDALAYKLRQERKHEADSTRRAQDSLMFVRWMERRARKK